MMTYEYTLYQGKRNRKIDAMLRECCFVWNHALVLQKRYYRLFGGYVGLNAMQKHFAQRITRRLLHSQTVQEVLERLDQAYKRFFKHLAKRPPKFRKAEYFRSFVYKQGGYKLNSYIIVLNRIKQHFQFSYSRPHEGNIQENPPKYYHNVCGDSDRLSICASPMCPEEESIFADKNVDPLNLSYRRFDKKLPNESLYIHI